MAENYASTLGALLIGAIVALLWVLAFYDRNDRADASEAFQVFSPRRYSCI
jgi:hypothetical protein